SAESPSFTPAQQEYRARLHSLATGKGIKVAIIHTGVSAHEQFPQLEAGPDLVVPDDPAPFHLCDIHGTVVASVIGARVMGIAPDATLMAIRQSSLHYRSTPDSESSGSLATMAGSVHAAVDAGARVISLSVVSCMTTQQAENLDSHGLTEALDRAERAGVVVLASAGNVDGDCEPGMVVYPAIEDTVITVAALSTEYELAGYSLPVIDRRLGQCAQCRQYRRASEWHRLDAWGNQKWQRKWIQWNQLRHAHGQWHRRVDVGAQPETIPAPSAQHNLWCGTVSQ